MKKIIAFIGSDRQKGTYESVQRFEDQLQTLESVDFEYIQLKDLDLDFCHGCKLCFDKGENHCPIKDDRDLILQKIETADGIVFATPNYAFSVSARMKNLIDRLAFTFHRPRFFDKTCTNIVVQGVLGGSKISKYLTSTARNIGFNTSKGCVINTLEPLTEKRYMAMDKAVVSCAKSFHKALNRPGLEVPSLIQLMLFRMTRTGIHDSSVKLYDYIYFEEQGWYTSDYYYQTSLGPVKRIMGKLFDKAGSLLAKSMA